MYYNGLTPMFIVLSLSTTVHNCPQFNIFKNSVDSCGWIIHGDMINMIGLKCCILKLYRFVDSVDSVDGKMCVNPGKFFFFGF